MLFASTERAVYVSFDEGDHWQSLRLNMAASSVRDVIIKDDDLVAATHGRGFWILDDITPLRQMSAEVASAKAHLFAPQTAVRFRWNRNTDTPLPPEEPAGKNPPDGAIIDYYLANAANGPVTLESLDASNKLVRKYASTDKALDRAKIAAENPIPMYWVRHEQELSGAAGMHRFVWDVHYAQPQALAHEYPIAAIAHDTPRYPLGAFALPGEYIVKLTVDGKTYAQPLSVKMDPRIKTSPGDLQKQFAMERGSVAGMNASYEALSAVQSVRAQLKERTEKAGKGAVSEKIAALDKALAAVEGAAVPGFTGVPPSGKQPENLSTLNQHFAAMLAVADSADAAPTTQADAAFRELNEALVGLVARWKSLRDSEIVVLNAELKKAGLAPIDPKEPPKEAPSDDAGGDDEP
jgi:hypothetical protein